MLRNYRPSDEIALLDLWNTSGASMGYAPLAKEGFRRILTGHPDFSPSLTFLLEEAEEILGFVSGSCPAGPRGYVTCLILKKESEAIERQLLSALETEFRNRGLHQSAVSFFNPVRLPWVLPGTMGHQHNNMPGIPTDLPRYEWFRDFGYRETSRECAMHLDLEEYEIPAWVEEKASRMAKEGYCVEHYNPERHARLQEMVDSLCNPLWSEEIPTAGKAGMNLLVGLKGNTCGGFAGPIYPEDTGRGYFSGIGVAPEFEHHGLGTLLFHHLLKAEKAAGARYMTLFTGEENPARKIYQGAGFRTKRTFGVFVKEL